MGANLIVKDEQVKERNHYFSFMTNKYALIQYQEFLKDHNESSTLSKLY